jgi:hypothetical protein
MNPDETFKYEYTQISSENKFSVPLSIGSSYIGGAHSHPDDGYAMFSFADVKFLMEAYDNASWSRKEDVFFMVVCKDDAGVTNTYTIKVDSFGELTTQVNAIWNNPDYIGLTDKAKLDKIHEKQADKYEKSKGNLERSFLEQFGEFGISLYKANDELTSWDNLKLENNVSGLGLGLLTKKPCN